MQTEQGREQIPVTTLEEVDVNKNRSYLALGVQCMDALVVIAAQDAI